MNILITGGASNIGYQVALKLSVKHKVFLTTHNQYECSKLKKSLKDNKNIECFKLDVTQDIDKIENLSIDCLINNAAIGIGGSVLGMDIKYLKEVFDTNFFYNIELIKKVYMQMEKKNQGKIFVMSSLASILPIPMLDTYCSSKAALSMIVTILNQELKISKSEVRISLIEPGAYHTGFNQVMIDNKDNYLDKNSLFYQRRGKFTYIQNLLFSIIEQKKINSIVNKIVKEVDKKHNKFHIRTPWIQVLGAKIYLLLFR